MQLPAITGGKERPLLPEARQLTIVGGSGAGKSRFMEELVRLNYGRAYCLSALSAPFPEREESALPGSIDALYREAASQRPYMRTDAVSELDKLIYMLFTDEFESLMMAKQSPSARGGAVRLKATRLDRISQLWERIYPGNRIVFSKGTLMFSTLSGDDLIPADRLSQGERTVLYYAAATLYAMPEAIVVIDSPSLFLHPSVVGTVWNAIEELRPDCTFIYNSVDVDFVSSRTRNVSIWVKNYDAEAQAWEYEVVEPGNSDEEFFIDLVGTRRPVLFIEGDARHSIDARLYPLVFPDCTVRPLGSCDKVIETTRSFNDLRSMHHLASRGIVDRDRRTDQEVDYLRRKQVMVPDVAEVENLFLLEGVVKTMARRRGRNPERLFAKVAREIENEFRHRYDEQALQHVRHRVKREVECRIDARFTCITAMETHLRQLINLLRPRAQYNELRSRFQTMLAEHDFEGILRVFNHKPMLGDCSVAHALGYRNKDEYVAGVISTLKEGSADGEAIRNSIRHCFHADQPSPGSGEEKRGRRNAPVNQHRAGQKKSERKVGEVDNKKRDKYVK